MRGTIRRRPIALRTVDASTEDVARHAAQAPLEHPGRGDQIRIDLIDSQLPHRRMKYRPETGDREKQDRGVPDLQPPTKGPNHR
jgi:hypothetical protein